LLLPSTTAAGRYTWYTDPLTNSVTLPNAPPGVGDPTVTVREDESGVLNASLTQAIDLSGELRKLLAAAQAGYRGEQARRWATVLDEQVDVARAYFDILAADRLTEVTQQTVAAQRRQLQNAEARYSSGRTTKNDLLVVQVTLQRSEQRLLIDQLARDRARWRLNQTLGLPVDAPTTVVDVGDPPQIPDVERALSDTWAHNPVVIARLEEQQRLEAGASSLRRSRLPRFGAGAAIDWTSSDIVDPQDVGSGFVGFSWDLGTDWRREADIAAADAAARQNKLELEADMRALEASVRLTVQSVTERLSAHETAKASVSQAEENLRIREQQFDVGRATSDDVLTAVTILARERATAATALYEAHTRAATLRQLMGLSLDGSSPQGR
jgi:outer membrane protein TolC